MTTTSIAETPLPRVELDADDVHVLITAWGTATVGDRSPDGTVMLYRETWDADSFEHVTATRTRLLVAHDAARAVGVLTTIKPTDAGLEGWGRLVGSASAKAHTRELVREGLHSAASVAFTPNDDHDIWSRPTTKNGLPTVTRRGARVKEASLVWQGAVPGSRVLEIATPPATPLANPVLRDAENAVHGGYGARFALDKQIDDHDERERRRQILEDADRLAAAGQRWRQHTDPVDIAAIEPSPRIRSLIDAQHQHHRDVTVWDQRMRELLDYRPTDQRGWDRWQTEYDRLMREKYPT